MLLICHHNGWVKLAPSKSRHDVFEASLASKSVIISKISGEPQNNSRRMAGYASYFEGRGNEAEGACMEGPAFPPLTQVLTYILQK